MAVLGEVSTWKLRIFILFSFNFNVYYGQNNSILNLNVLQKTQLEWLRSC